MKNQVKINIVHILLFSFLMILFQACDEQWLEPEPLSIYVPENVYIDKAGFEGSLLTLREGLRDEIYDGSRMLASELYNSDISICGSEVPSLPKNFITQITPTANIADMPILKYWDLAYTQIRNANVVISRIDDVDISDQDKNQIKAEALFFRAYWYYRLINLYGDVPFLNKEYTIPKLDFYSHTRNSISNKIQEDLEFAVQYLPSNVEPGKVNLAAGFHLLTKVYLANLHFDKAIQSASSIIDDGKYSLMNHRFGVVSGDNRFNVIWDLHQKENKSISENTEAILVVQDKYGFPGSTSGTNTMRDLTPFWSHGSYIKDPEGKPGMTSSNFNAQILALGRGVGYCRSSTYFEFDIWKDALDDLRHDTDTNWMPRTKLRYNNPSSNYYGQVVQPQYISPYDTMRSYFGWPQYKVYVANEPTVGRPVGGNSDWYIFRLAETYLLRAEAYYWTGELEKAAADINKVRERAKAPSISASDVTIEYILAERARELYYEEPRKSELTRIAFIMATKGLRGYSIDSFSEKNFWFDHVTAVNKFYNTGFSYGGNVYTIAPYHVLSPVPQDEIDANTGGRINQNIGYQGADKNVPPQTEIQEDK